jgi:hypothetical protein
MISPYNVITNTPTPQICDHKYNRATMLTYIVLTCSALFYIVSTQYNKTYIVFICCKSSLINTMKNNCTPNPPKHENKT